MKKLIFIFLLGIVGCDTTHSMYPLEVISVERNPDIDVFKTKYRVRVRTLLNLEYHYLYTDSLLNVGYVIK